MQRVIPLANQREARLLFGVQERNLRSVRDAFDVQIVARDSYLRVEGAEEAVGLATRALETMRELAKGGSELTTDDVDGAIGRAAVPSSGDSPRLVEVMRGRSVEPKTPGQKRYVEMIKRFDVVFCIGPAGTGKTYLAVAMAISALKKQLVQRIVLARPAVEAGERLGFLPGDIRAKVNPYLRPLYDALNEMMPFSQMRKFLENDLIEIVPLAYMRGRTLDAAFIILDEAQNCTVKQMKTFLTRMGQQSKIVVTGDVTQIDLESDDQSGLLDARRTLADVPSIAFVNLGMEDIVRHRLVQDIVDAYDGRPNRDERPESAPEAGEGGPGLAAERHHDESEPDGDTNGSASDEAEPGLEA